MLQNNKINAHNQVGRDGKGSAENLMQLAKSAKDKTSKPSGTGN